MRPVVLGLGIVLLVGMADSSAAQTNRRTSDTRFPGMDRNNDGRITRSEWRGDARTFEANDWNNDDVLSGDELRLERPRGTAEFGAADEFDDWTAGGFTSLDRDRNNRISSNEWSGSRAEFRRVDENGDGTISRPEFLDQADFADDRSGRREDRFTRLDRNRDNRVDRGEWNGASARYDALDANGDGVLTRAEMVDRAREVEQPSVRRPQTNAFRAGYVRGLADGRKAGREDRETNWGWDLEGQIELESADAGYTASVGSRQDYETGYREGFRNGYPDGFGSNGR